MHGPDGLIARMGRGRGACAAPGSALAGSRCVPLGAGPKRRACLGGRCQPLPLQTFPSGVELWRVFLKCSHSRRWVRPGTNRRRMLGRGRGHGRARSAHPMMQVACGLPAHNAYVGRVAARRAHFRRHSRLGTWVNPGLAGGGFRLELPTRARRGESETMGRQESHTMCVDGREVAEQTNITRHLSSFPPIWTAISATCACAISMHCLCQTGATALQRDW